MTNAIHDLSISQTRETEGRSKVFPSKRILRSKVEKTSQRQRSALASGASGILAFVCVNNTPKQFFEASGYGRIMIVLDK